MSSTFGYAGKILRVDLTSGNITETPTADYADRFLGGRGIAAKIYWDEVSPEVGAMDPENRIIFATGPLCGVPGFAGSRWTVCGKSADNEMFSYCNLGGKWGAELKFAGYDLLVVQGASEDPVYLLIEDNKVELRDASHLWGKGTIETRETLKSEHGKSARVVAVGPAAENRAVMAIFFADNDASGSGELAASLGAKKMKAVVVKGSHRKVAIAQPDRLRGLADMLHDLKVAFPTYDWQQTSRWSRDLVLEFRAIPEEQMKPSKCYGCSSRCARKSYQAADGTKGKFICHSAFFYQPWAERYYGEWNDVPFHATRLCDNYGLGTIGIDKIMIWLDGCHKAGLLTEENTGLPLSKIGSHEFIEGLVRKVALREGIGDVLAEGYEKARSELLPRGAAPIKSGGIVDEPGFFDPYGPRLFIANGFMYAMEPTFPIGQLHEISISISRWRSCRLGMATYLTSDMLRTVARRFWGSEIAADFTTYEGKALAAKRIQDRQYAKECLILCDYLWPMMHFEFTEDHIGDPTLESRILSAVIGKDVDEPGLRAMGERVFNLQRAIVVREGHAGREFDRLDERCFTEPLEYDISTPDLIVPGKDGEPTSRQGAVVDRDKWEAMKDEYYALREWDVETGLQTREKLAGLDLEDIGQTLYQMKLAV